MADGNGTAGVRVFAYPVSSLALAGDSPLAGTNSDEQGRFALTLPPGQYYLLARGAGWFSYYGRNPLTVPPEGVAEINLPLARDIPVGDSLANSIEQGVVGRVLHDGRPVANAVVFVYPDLSAQFKGFGLAASAPTGPDGLFELPLSTGTYYLVARVRHSGSMAGPLAAGDLFGYLPDNPVTISDGRVTRVSLPVIVVPEKVTRHAAALFGQTRVSGMIVDRSGKPLAGLQALLYVDETMLNRPLFVSPPTGPDGIFQLSFPSGGTYYLAARNSLGGTPAPGELYGRFRGPEGAGVKVETGKSVDGIRIVVEEVY